MTVEEPTAPADEGAVAEDDASGPTQKVSLLAAEAEGAGDVGPKFPSGMNTTEALLAGATTNLGDSADAAIAAAKGEEATGETPGEETTPVEEETAPA